MPRQLNLIKDIIKKIISEDLARTKKTVSRGFGTSQPYTIGSDRPMLGTVEAEDKGSVPDLSPVKISRAFSKYANIDSPELS